MLDQVQKLTYEQIAKYLPHGEELLCLEAIESLGVTNVSVLAIAGRSACMSWFDKSGAEVIPSTVAVEYIAQAASLGKALLASQSGNTQIRSGMLLRLRNISLHRDYFFKGEELRIEVTWGPEFNSAFSVEGKVLAMGSSDLLVEGVLTLREAV